MISDPPRLAALGMSVFFAAMASAAPPALRELAQRISHEPLEAERLCLIDANGGASAELLDALTEEFEGIRTKQPLPVARAFATLVERLARERGQLRAQSRALSGIGATYVTERRAAEAESYFQQAYAVAQLSSDDDVLAIALYNLAVLHRSQAQNDLV